MRFPEIVLRLPEWLEKFLSDMNRIFPTVEERMDFVIEIARLNVQHQTGGPFAAAVFEQTSGRLIAPGVNMVETTNCSAAHAEIVSISMAQKSIGFYDLGAKGYPSMELVSSTEPCAMCLGAIPWSGIRRLVVGARDEDARAIGFDEGFKTANWVQCLKERGINVVQDVLRSKAVVVLKDYAENGGLIYNARQGN